MAKGISDLKNQIKEQFKRDMGNLAGEFTYFVAGDIQSGVSGSLRIPTDAKLIKSTSPPSASNIASALSPNVSKSGEHSYLVKFWHVPSLESQSTPGGAGNIPLWSSLNWGSGPNRKMWKGKRAQWSVSQWNVHQFMDYQVPLRTKRGVKRRMSIPPYTYAKDDTFLWYPRPGRGDRGQGYYIPQKRALATGVKTEPMEYFRPQFYIEKSVTKALTWLRSAFSAKQGFKAKSPIK